MFSRKFFCLLFFIFFISMLASSAVLAGESKDIVGGFYEVATGKYLGIEITENDVIVAPNRNVEIRVDEGDGTGGYAVIGRVFYRQEKAIQGTFSMTDSDGNELIAAQPKAIPFWTGPYLSVGGFVIGRSGFGHTGTGHSLDYAGKHISIVPGKRQDGTDMLRYREHVVSE